MRPLLLVIAALALLAATPASAAESYDALVARLKSGDAKIDYTALRNAYAASPKYKPYGGDIDDPRQAMIAAFNKSDCAKAIAEGDKILAVSYVDITTHLVLGRCYEQTNSAAKAEFHRAVAHGLMDSIMASGDGKTTKTAFIVITVTEEYDVLRASRLTLKLQSLVQADGHSYDSMQVKTESGTDTTVYFQIDGPMTWLSKSLR